MNQVLVVYETAKTKFAEMDLLFDCVDLDRNDCMEFNEFIGLYRYIENVTNQENLEKMKEKFINSTKLS